MSIKPGCFPITALPVPFTTKQSCIVYSSDSLVVSRLLAIKLFRQAFEVSVTEARGIIDANFGIYRGDPDEGIELNDIITLIAYTVAGGEFHLRPLRSE